MSTPAPLTTCEVFISYASQDADQVVAIAQLLETAGISVWRDGERILGGQYYGEQIVHALAQSRVVLLMCSPKSLNSDNVHREVLLAWEWGARHYVPVWITPPTDIPERFRYCLVGCQWVDAHAEKPDQWLPRLLSALESQGVHATGSTKEGDTGVRSPSTGRESQTADRKPRFQPGDRPIPGADWQLLTLLGKGGFGEVWKAHNPQLANQPPVALKFCLRLDERGRELLRHEADMVLRVQQQLKSDRIVPLLHAYLNNDPPCLEYPYIEGGTLVQFIEHGRQGGVNLTPDKVEVIVRQIANVVGAAHRATPKLVHRDLKPANVLVERRPDGKRLLRVTDFGIGAIISQPLLEQARTSSSLQANMASVLSGAYTPLYASPQQIRGDKPDPRDDVYSLGVIWYQLLTSDLTSPAPTGRMWSQPLRQRGMSDAAIDLLSSCFESDLAYRPADAGVLAEKLMGLVQSGATKRDTFDELPFVLAIDPPPRTERPQRAAGTKSGPRPILNVVPIAEPILKVQPTTKSQPPPLTKKVRPVAPTVRSALPLPEVSGREPQRPRMPRPARRLWPVIVGVAACVILVSVIATVWFSVQKVSEASDRINSANNLKQIGIALVDYSDANRSLPPAALPNKAGERVLSWRVAILPFLGEDQLYKQFNLEEPWDGPNNRRLLNQMPKVFAHRGADSTKTAAGFTHYRVFVGPQTVFEPPLSSKQRLEGLEGLEDLKQALEKLDQKLKELGATDALGVRLSEITDGTSNTIFVAEAAEPVEWTKPDDLPFGPGIPLPKLGLSGATQVLLGDGSIHTLQKGISEATLRAAITRNGGEVLGPDW